MSSNTKIIVLKSKELIYTGIFIVFGILLVLLLFYMFSPSSKKDAESENQTSSQPGTDEVEETINTYKPGVYSSVLSLGGSELTCTVTVDKDSISHIDITNLDETVTAMYPLLQPSLDEINAQIAVTSDINDITYSKDNHYTTVIIMEAVKQALSSATQ